MAVCCCCSRKEGPVIPLLHTLGPPWFTGLGSSFSDRLIQPKCFSLTLKEVPSAEIVTCRGGTPSPAAMTACPSFCSLTPPALGLEGIPGCISLLNKFIQSLPTRCLDAAAPADYFIENGWCHHRVIERSQEFPLHSKGSELPQQMESALTFLICCCSVISLVQFIVQVNSQALERCHHPNVCPWMFTCVQGCLCRPKSTISFLVLPLLSWRWFCWHQSTKSWISSL